MPVIKWETLLTNAEGVIEYDRLSRFVAILLACLGALVVIIGAVLELGFGKVLPSEHADTAVWALVLPFTGGKIADAFGRKAAP
jgi:hypothetical protein